MYISCGAKCSNLHNLCTVPGSGSRFRFLYRCIAVFFHQGSSKAYMPKKVPNIQRKINNDILKIVLYSFLRRGKLPPPERRLNLCYARTITQVVYITSSQFMVCLHLKFVLRFLVRFSPSDACEWVEELPIMFILQSTCTFIWTFITYPLVHIHQKKKIAAKISSVNKPLYFNKQIFQVCFLN
jgi:hypothetical protein